MTNKTRNVIALFKELNEAERGDVSEWISYCAFANGMERGIKEQPVPPQVAATIQTVVSITRNVMEWLETGELNRRPGSLLADSDWLVWFMRGYEEVLSTQVKLVETLIIRLRKIAAEMP
jgi:hypothetical protein